MSDLDINIISDPASGDIYIYRPYLGPYSSIYGALGTSIIINTHGHTTESDGSFTPAQFAAIYQGKSHGALIITDHDMITADPGGHSLVYIQSNELSSSSGHIVSLNSDYVRGGTSDRQTEIDAVIADGGYPILAHPKWYVGFSQAIMASLTDYLGIEIFNMLVESGAGGHNPITYPGFDIIDWDYLLTNVRRNIWGIASDDFHNVGDYKYYDGGRLTLFTNGTTLTDILYALENGNFVAEVTNYGVTPEKPNIHYPSVSIHCNGAKKIRFIGDNGILLSEVISNEGNADYIFSDDDTYVRIEVVGDYMEDFADALDDRWIIATEGWTLSGGILTQNFTIYKAKYILRRWRDGDFDAQVDVRLNSLNNDFASLMFNVLDSSHYYIMILGSSGTTWENTFSIACQINNTFTDALESYSFTPSVSTWYTIKMKYTSTIGRIQAKVWATGGSEPDWQLDCNDTTWKHGAFGLCGVDGPNDFDNLYINGFKTYYQPIPIGG